MEDYGAFFKPPGFIQYRIVKNTLKRMDDLFYIQKRYLWFPFWHHYGGPYPTLDVALALVYSLLAVDVKDR